MTGDIDEQNLISLQERQERTPVLLNISDLDSLTKHDVSLDLNTIVTSSCFNSMLIRQDDFASYVNFSMFQNVSLELNFKFNHLHKDFLRLFSMMKNHLDIRLLGSAHFSSSDLPADLTALVQNKFYGPYIS